MSRRRLALWAVGAVFAFSLLLSALAVRELTAEGTCPTGEFDTVAVERLGREWVPPRLLCRVTLRDGSTHNASVNYWPAFAFTGASGIAIVVLLVQHRRPRDRSNGSSEPPAPEPHAPEPDIAENG